MQGARSTYRAVVKTAFWLDWMDDTSSSFDRYMLDIKELARLVPVMPRYVEPEQVFDIDDKSIGDTAFEALRQERERIEAQHTGNCLCGLCTE